MRLRLLVVLATLLLSVQAQAAVVDGGLFGPVKIALPDGSMKGYVVLFSDKEGWTPDDDRVLASLAAKGALAVGVDTKVYLAKLSSRESTTPATQCASFFGDAEILSRQLQRLHPSIDYVFPVLAGVGEGGVLAYATLAQAPANTFAGAISMDPTPGLSVPFPICPDLTSKPDIRGRYMPGPTRDLHGFWTVAFDRNAEDAGRSRVEALKNDGTPLNVRTVEGTDTAAALVSLVEPHLAAIASRDVTALPIIPLPVDKPSRMMAVVLSGDGGWRDLDKRLADRIQSMGVPVVGWDSLRYFWRVKTPDQTAADLAAVLENYSTRWKAEKIALIGYSFGADVLPFLYDRLPPTLRAKVTMVSLLGLESKADWEITVTGWLGAPPSDAAIPVAPALAAMPAGLIQCFYGSEETESACPTLDASHVELIKTAGGHHFGHDYDAIAQTIMDGFQRRAAR